MRATVQCGGTKSRKGLPNLSLIVIFFYCNIFEVNNRLTRKQNRIAIWDGSNGCFYCHKGGPMALDHIIPKSQGGSWRVSNLRLACRECNQKRGRDLLRFLKKAA
mmetsp:Transcript_123819/g.346742  ORF Transcript_123819/g.346742 Transcript_123819/m.346742 type:complete len:105 (+) Transcript_123819:776-1090(+)